MVGIFGHDYHLYPFELFQIHHVLMLVIFLIGCIFLYIFKNHLKSYDKSISMIIFLTLVIFESAYHFWLYVGGRWDISFTLPLQLCSISLILSLILLATNIERVFQFFYYLGLSGAMQALLTPELFVGFPHFRFIQFFYTHIMIIWVALYYVFVKGYRPSLKGLFESFLFLNLMALLTFFVNKWIDGNYMFLARKPTNPSLLDYLGPYPYYIFSLEGMAFFLFYLLYLPFASKLRMKERQKG